MTDSLIPILFGLSLSGMGALLLQRLARIELKIDSLEKTVLSILKNNT